MLFGMTSGVGIMNYWTMKHYQEWKENFIFVNGHSAFNPNFYVPVLTVRNIVAATVGGQTGHFMTTRPGFILFSFFATCACLAKACIYKFEEDTHKK